MKYQIRHMGVGGILDQSIYVVRDHAKLLFGIAGITIVPCQIIMGFVTLQLQSAILVQDQTQIIILTLLMMATLLISIPASILAQATLTQAIAMCYLSRETTMRACFQHAAKRFLAFLGTYLLIGLVIATGFVFCLVPGIVLALWFGLSHYIAVLEPLAGIDAMKRSRELMKGSISNAVILGVIVLALNFMVVGGAAFIPEKHVQAIVSSFAQGVTSVLDVATGVVLYFSCRCKVENFDLDFLANAIHASASEMPANEPVSRDQINPLPQQS